MSPPHPRPPYPPPHFIPVILHDSRHVDLEALYRYDFPIKHEGGYDMAVVRIHREEDDWISLIREARASKQSIKDWCLMKGINRTSYYYWLARLKEKGILTETSQSRQNRSDRNKVSSNRNESPEGYPCFVEFIMNKEEPEREGRDIPTRELAQEFQESKIMIQHNSYQVFVGNGFSEDTLKRVLEVVGKC